MGNLFDNKKAELEKIIAESEEYINSYDNSIKEHQNNISKLENDLTLKMNEMGNLFKGTNTGNNQNSLSKVDKEIQKIMDKIRYENEQKTYCHSNHRYYQYRLWKYRNELNNLLNPYTSNIEYIIWIYRDYRYYTLNIIMVEKNNHQHIIANSASYFDLTDKKQLTEAIINTVKQYNVNTIYCKPYNKKIDYYKYEKKQLVINRSEISKYCKNIVDTDYDFI